MTALMFLDLRLWCHRPNFKARKLTKYKERRLDGYHGGPHIGENLADVLNEIDEPEEAVAEDVEDFIDPEAAQVTKIKR